MCYTGGDVKMSVEHCLFQREWSVQRRCLMTGVVLKLFSRIQILTSMTWSWSTTEVICIFLVHRYARSGIFLFLVSTVKADIINAACPMMGGFKPYCHLYHARNLEMVHFRLKLLLTR